MQSSGARQLALCGFCSQVHFPVAIFLRVCINKVIRISACVHQQSNPPDVSLGMCVSTDTVSGQRQPTELGLAETQQHDWRPPGCVGAKTTCELKSKLIKDSIKSPRMGTTPIAVRLLERVGVATFRLTTAAVRLKQRHYHYSCDRYSRDEDEI